MRKGGYVLYIRHTSTDFSKDDSKMVSFEDCANQRPLTDTGRAEARAIAGHLQRLKIPLDRVYASPFCRLLSTPPAPGTNNAISSHGNPFYAVSGAPYLAEGEIAVVRPLGKAGFDPAGRIKLEDWAALK